MIQFTDHHIIIPFDIIILTRPKIRLDHGIGRAGLVVHVYHETNRLVKLDIIIIEVLALEFDASEFLVGRRRTEQALVVADASGALLAAHVEVYPLHADGPVAVGDQVAGPWFDLELVIIIP